ncbi:MAG TPA: hypothetical protein PLR06_10875, partial [Cyclobacteriaceae bacterium]|nr:hypothetical protein [Cyclobacteriaceae bacterium]
MRFSIAHGKPSVLKKKYEAYRTAQEGISNNRVRIDSLEREVHALRTAMTIGPRGTTIVNNYYGNDSTSTRHEGATYLSGTTGSDEEAARLREENDFLTRELARANIQQRNDSVYALSLEDAGGRKEKEELKAQHEAKKTATKQADATEDMAKEMDRINKRMRQQNKILAAGVATGIVAAASSGDKKEEKAALPDSVVAINDSMVVIGSDTTRLVMPKGAQVRMRSTGDSAIVTVYDTVRVTVRDTVRVTADPIRTTTAADEAELHRLTEPIYYATGSTTLGPQG